MNKTTKRILVIIPLCVVVMLAALWAVLAYGAPVDNTAARSVSGVAPALGSGDTVYTLTEDTAPAAPANGRIDSAGKLLYMLNDANTENTYYLEADFVITAFLWSKMKDYSLTRKFTIDGGSAKHSITYAPNNTGADTVLSTSLYGGMFASFSGTLKNMEYRFMGNLEACAYDINSKSDDSVILCYGGLAGIFSGNIDNCTISIEGTISAYANRDKCTIYTGGIAGQMKGAVISNSTINMSGSISSASLYEVEGKEIKRSTLENLLYAGGIAAHTTANNSVQTTIKNSSVTVSGPIYTHDNATKASGLSGLFQNKNKDTFIFPAGGLVATADGLVLEYNTIGITGNINSTGGEISGVEGAIVGGLVGYSTSSTYLSFSANVLHLTATLMASHERDNANVYKGGFVGRFAGLASSAQGKLAKNAIYYSMRVAKSTVDGTEYYGYFCANNGGNFKTWNAGNNWMVIQGSDKVSSVTDIVKTACTPNADCGTMGILMVYGGGSVSATVKSNTITFYANQQYSPFYNWLSAIDGTTATPYTVDVNTAQAQDFNGDPYTQYMFTPTTASAGKTVYAVFLTTQIRTAGQLVQWTEEMNSGLNRKWVKATLMDNVTVYSGVNIVNDFYGEFDGNGKTLIFNTDSALNGVKNLKVDSTKGLDEPKVVFGVTGSSDKEYSAAGLFRIVRAGAKIHDFTYIYAGKMVAGDGNSLYAVAGALAACNYGYIYNIDFNLPQAGNLTANASSSAYAGGLVGIDYAEIPSGSNVGAIHDINAIVAGRIKASASGNVTGGLIGAALKSNDIVYSRINLDVRGQVNAFINTDSGSARTAGLVGSVSSVLKLYTVVVNVRDNSNIDGDVLVATCKHNPEFYQTLLQEVRAFNVNAGTASDDLDEIYAILFGDPDIQNSNHMCSGSTTNVAFETLKANVNTAIINKSTLTNAWFKENVLKLAETIDCNAPCYTCSKKCSSAHFCASLSHGKDLSQVWAIGSYAQFAGSAEHPQPGVSRIPYFGEVEDTVESAMEYYLNLIYVQDGTASCAMGDELTFFVPVEDSSHVFTGWFVTYNLTQMADSHYIRDNYFVPTTQSGSVWYSRIINSMLINADELAVLAATTNAGQRYEGITFTLGSNITVANAFNPIGTVANYFNGTFDGKGYAIVLSGGFADSYNVDGEAVPYTALGVFGCLGNKALVKQLCVKINSSIDVSTKLVGLVCAINNGKVGQNAAEDIRVYINRDVKASVAGGVVGVNSNKGTVQNAAVYFAETGAKLSTTDSTFGYLGGASIAGGAVAYNLGTVRNVQVTMYKNETVNALSDKGIYKGGIVGYNEAQLYSSVACIYTDSDEAEVVTLTGSTAGILVGYNASENIDSLWAVYCLSNDDGFIKPDTQTLLNGIGDANRLVRYGYGDIETEILGNTASQLMGGTILFSAVEDSVHKVPFYEFTQSFDSAQHEEGSGSTFMPAVGAELSGKTYYAIFANAEITDEKDFYAFIQHINSGFRAYVEYTINLKGGTVVGLDINNVNYNSIGAGHNVFVGAFNANNVPIELTTSNSEGSTVPLFGTIGATSIVRNLNLRYFENVNVRKGYAYTIADQSKWLLGAVAYVNLGVIDNLTMTFESGLYGSQTGFGTQGYADYSGVVVGYNNGQIVNSKIACVAGTYPGHKVAGSVYGAYSGVIAGYNDVNGIIGSADIASITVNMDAGVGRTSSVVGVQAAGAVVGYNAGTVANATANVRGYIGTPVAKDNTMVMGYDAAYEEYYVALNQAAIAYVGGIAGYNEGTLYGVVVHVDEKATVQANQGYVGGIVGNNAFTGSVGTSGGTDTVTVEWNSVFDGAAYFGGVAGNNRGTVYRASVVINASLNASQRVGGVAGANSGRLYDIETIVSEDVRLTAANGYVGGVVGYNEGNVFLPSVVVYGYLGDDNTYAVGGFAGYTSAVFSNGYAVLYHDVGARANGKKGVALGYSAQAIEDGEPVAYGVNTWAATFNSVRIGASASADSGFNVLKVVGNQMVTAAIEGTVSLPRIRFSTIMTGVNWYSDITNLSYIYGNDGRPVNGSTYLPLADLQNCVYHLCKYDLTVDSENDLANLYSYINSADLFYGVTFRVTGNIDVNTKIQPIGTLEHPFTGIFDGNNKTISFRQESGIVGSEYSGLFGYVADCALLRNFVLQIDEGVQISSTTGYVGTLAGCIDGQVVNVAINMRSAPTSRTESTVVGALAGKVGATALFDNTWISVYNSSVDAVVGQDNCLAANKYNVLNVFGRGVLSFAINASTHAFTFTVIQGLDFFDNWYADFNQGAAGVFSGNAIGTYSGLSSDEVKYSPNVALRAKVYTASFISLIIRNAEDFYQFAQNINDFGVDGARFTMDLGVRVYELVLDLSRMQPIGTNSHPFRATFDGSVTNVGVDTGAYTLILQGSYKQEDDYSGLFGNVGAGAVIRNLVVKADPNVAQQMGSNTSISTGFLAATMSGTVEHPVTLESVVVIIGDNTTLINGRSDAIGSIAGLWGRNVNAVNTWAVLPEMSTYGMIGSYHSAEGLQVYVEGAPRTVALPCTMYLCGEGAMSVKHIMVDNTNPNHFTYNITFTLDTSDNFPFRFIDKYGSVEYSSADKQVTFAATGALSNWHDSVYLALYLKTDIESADELSALADLVEAGRNYHNVVYSLTKDITLNAAQWKPIGGSVETAVGSQEYKQVPFVGILDGQGHTITMPAGLWTDAEYAGLFGILSEQATVRNLYLSCSAAIGTTMGSQYAGALAAIDQGATLRNIIVDISTQATFNAKLSTGRVAVNQALVYDVDGYVTNYSQVNKAYNVWVLCYNSHYTVDQNNAEAAFNNALPVDTTQPFVGVGSYNGGVNVLTMIANGTVTMTFRYSGNDIVGVRLQEAGANRVKEWYYYLADGTKQDCSSSYGRVGDSDRLLDADVCNQIVYASFVKETIATLTDLIRLGNDVAVGCDLYDITFTLACDITISAQTLSQANVDSFAPLGTATTAFNAIFDGCGHTLYLAPDVVVTGTYAGIFGVTGEDALLTNIKLQLAGTLGNASTQYAGAVAYNKGRLGSVIIDATALQLYGATAGAAFGYDESNLHTNTWLFVKGSDTFAAVGRVKNNTNSRINILKVVGMGTLVTEFAPTDVAGVTHYYVRMYNNDTEHAVLGWYSDFAQDNQLSTALNITPAAYPAITAGDHGTFVASDELSSRRYEVVIISTVITNQQDLVKLAADVNVGGYTFANTTFTLGADIDLTSMQFVSIGTATTPFEGTFQGSVSNTGSYYTITMHRQDSTHTDQGVALFGYNNGTIENLLVRVAVDIIDDEEMGAIARFNDGVILNCMVALIPAQDRVSGTVSMRGRYVGGVAGINRGTVRNCIAYIDSTGIIVGTTAAGGLVGQNRGSLLGTYGGNNGELSIWQNNTAACHLRTDYADGKTLQWASVVLYGVVRVENNTDNISLFAGGAVGDSLSRAEINRLSVIVTTQGSVQGQGFDLQLGGMAGRSLSALTNSTVLFEGQLTYRGAQATVNGVAVGQPKLDKVYSGYFVGHIQSSATNSWLIARVGESAISAVGLGSSVNVLQINGKGYIDSYIDRSDNILFYNTTPQGGASIDGWYLSSGISAAAIGGVDQDSFAPNRTVMGYTVTVVFISTTIGKVEELLDMAQTVNAGLFATDLHFELTADIDVDAAATGLMSNLAIGTQQNPFKHTFDGNGYTITFHGGTADAATAYLGLFGYIGSGAVISNINIVFGGGTYGLAGTTYAIGGLAGVNYGVIDHCTVTLGAAATQLQSAVAPVLVGVKVGGIVGENFGTVSNCSLTTWAYLRADNGPKDLNGSQYVGGVVGANSGMVTNITATLAGEIAGKHWRYTDSSIDDDYTGSSYVGGVCGINKKELSMVTVYVGEVTISAYSAVLAYAGGVCGNNTGSIMRVYVDFTEDAKIYSDNAAGGLVGANNNKLANILVAYRNTCRVLQDVDAAVGDTGTEGKADCVWVFNYNDALDSTARYINNMTSGSATVTYNDPAEIVADGTILFYAAINATNGLTVYASAPDYAAVLLDDFVYYYVDSQNVKFLALNANAFVATALRESVAVKAEIRRELGHQSELKAIAKCLADANGQNITGVYTLGKDIDVDGTYRSIGTATRPFAATLSGNMHEIRFGADTVYDAAGAGAVFEYLTGRINQLVIRLHAPLTGEHTAGIAWQNNGALNQVVVYAYQGVGLVNPTYASDSHPASANTQVWVVSRDVVSIETNTNLFGSILVAGPGSLSVRLQNNNLVFHADFEAPNTFAGWSNRSTMFADNEQTLDFDAQAMIKAHDYRFRVDFISTNIATDADMANLIQLLAMNYTGVKQASGSVPTVYYLTDDIHVNGEDFANYFGDFGGVLDGNFHTLTVDGNYDAVFGAFKSEMRNIIVDATAITGEGDSAYHLFAAGAKASLLNTAFYVSGKAGSLQPLGTSGLRYNRVYLVMTEAVWYAQHYDNLPVADYLDIDHVGLIVTQRGQLYFGLDNKFNFVMTIEDNVDSYYFAGWTDLVDKTIAPDSTVLLTGTQAYRAGYVKSQLVSEADLLTLAASVNAGRTFEGFDFALGNNIDVASATLTLGKNGKVFAGNLDGNNHTINITVEGNAPLFGTMGGTLVNLVFATQAGGIAQSITGTLHNVVVASSAADAVFADSVTGNIGNAWLVVKGGQIVSLPDDVKVVVMQDVVEVLGISVVGGIMHIDFQSSDADKFMVWRNADGSVKDVGNYNFISSDVDTDDYYYVEATNIIADASEYVYFAKATSAKYSSVAYLGADITLGAATLQQLHYVYNLDGQGHTITIESSAALCLVGEGTTGVSSINNLVLDILPTVATFTLCRQSGGTGSCNFNNIFIRSQGTAISWSNCTFVNTWWLHKAGIVDDIDAAYNTLPVGVNVVRYAVGDLVPSITIKTIENQRVVSLSVKESEYGVETDRNLHFLGFYFDGANHNKGKQSLAGTASDSKRYQAFFATPQMATSADWTHNALAMGYSGESNIALTLTADIEAQADFIPFTLFDGTLDGAFHSIILHGGVNAQQVVQTRAGAVSNLAVEIYHDYTYTDVTWLQVTGEGSVSNCWIVNDTLADLQHAVGVRVMRVQDELSKAQKQGTGILVGDDGQAFVFVPDDKNEYRLHYYKEDKVGGLQYEEDAWSVLFQQECTDDIIAIFNRCFTITVEANGIAKSLVAAKGDAFLTQTTPRWSDAGIYTVQYKDLGQLRQIAGYLFVGFNTTSTSNAITKRTLTEWDVDTAVLDESVTITANFIQITSNWKKGVSFGDLTDEQMDQYLVMSSDIYQAIDTLNETCIANGWPITAQVTRSVEIDGDVKGLVNNKPYHAGGYIVSFNVFYMEGSVRRYLGVSDGLSFRITARELHFERIDIEPKKYDGTSTAHVTHIELGGFASDAIVEAEYKQQVGMAGVVLQYYDEQLQVPTANAGTWGLIVAEGSYLEAATLNSTVLFDSDYMLPTGVLYLYTAQNENNVMQYVRADSPCSADILKQDLDMLVEDISMEYLEQFGSFDGEGNYTPIHIHDHLVSGVRITGFINEQEEADIKEKASKLLRVAGDATTVDADGNVDYTYYLRQPGTYFIEVISDALANYEPRISSHKATLTILPSAVTVQLATVQVDETEGYVAANSVQYGDVPGGLHYTLYYGGEARLPVQALADAVVTAPAGVYGNVGAQNWFAVTIRPVAAYANQVLVPFNMVDVGVAGMQFAYSAQNTALLLDDVNMATATGTVAVQVGINADNTKEYLVTQADVLLVQRREVTYQVTSGNTKVFGSDDAVLAGHTVGKALAEGDRLVFSRQGGELVGEYDIYVRVVDANGADVSARYLLQPYANRNYNYQIVKRTVVVTRTGTGIFYYGSSDIANMPYALSISSKIKDNILKALDVKGVFDNMVEIEIGYFGRVLQDVSDTPYTTVEMEHSYSGNLARKRADADRCMEFVLDEKSCTYMIVRAPLHVKLGNFARDYDTTVPDQDSLRNQLPLEVEGWADDDADYLEVRVGSYECSNLSAASGTYFITPAGLVIAYRNGSGTRINNYVIDTVQGGNYTIKGITVSVSVKIGAYNEEGSFADSNGTRTEDGTLTGSWPILFGSSDNVWYFDTKIDSLPAYLRTAYYTQYPKDAPATDLQKTQWLQSKLGIVAADIGSLSAGTGITADYKPYSNNPNITLNVLGANYRVNAVRIQLDDIKVTAASAKSRPEVSFEIKVFSVDANGVETDITDTYCTNNKFNKVAEGDRVNINDALSLMVSYTAYTVNDCMLNLTPYVLDNNTWYVYDQITNDPVVVYASKDEDGNDIWEASANIMQAVDVNPGVWATLVAALQENLTVTVVGTLAGVAVIVMLGVLGVLLRRRERLRRAVQRMLANDAYFRANPQAAVRPQDDFDFDDEPPVDNTDDNNVSTDGDGGETNQ